MNDPLELAEHLVAVCTEVEARVATFPASEARAWGTIDARRHAHTLRALLTHYEGRSGPLRVLNASGLYNGHQDLSIASYLTEVSVPYMWTAVESPESRFLTHPWLKERLTALGITVELVDYATPDALAGTSDATRYDAVLFTEIAEHLDHSAFLRALRACRSRMAADGILILTTPNLVSLPNRVRLMFGKGDGPYFGDGIANLDAGLNGHVVNYDRHRLMRLLADVGLRVEQAYTFNWGRPWAERGAPGRVLATVDRLLTRLIPDAGQTVFLRATPGEPFPIPFHT